MSAFDIKHFSGWKQKENKIHKINKCIFFGRERNKDNRKDFTLECACDTLLKKIQQP